MFPEAAPDIRVLGEFAHAIIDDRGSVVGNKKLSSWNSKMDLSRVLQEIAAEFKRNPPRQHASRPASMLPQGQWNMPATSISYQPQPPARQQSVSLPTQPQQQPLQPQQQQQRQSLPQQAHFQVPQTFPELEQMSREQLETLLSDAQNYIAFLDSLPAVVNPRKVLDETSADNVSRARMYLILMANSLILRQKQILPRNPS